MFSQKSTLAVIPQAPSTLLFDSGSFYGLALARKLRLTETPRVCPVSASPVGLQMYATVAVLFT